MILHWIPYHEKKKAAIDDITGKLTKLEHGGGGGGKSIKKAVLMVNFLNVIAVRQIHKRLHLFFENIH